VAAMHPAFVGFAEGRGAGTDACLVHDGPAAIAVGLQQPAMVEGGRLARCATVPAKPAAGDEFMDTTLDRETEGRPAPAPLRASWSGPRRALPGLPARRHRDGAIRPTRRRMFVWCAGPGQTPPRRRWTHGVASTRDETEVWRQED
jgi:hypothetical protein